MSKTSFVLGLERFRDNGNITDDYLERLSLITPYNDLDPLDYVTGNIVAAIAGQLLSYRRAVSGGHLIPGKVDFITGERTK